MLAMNADQLVNADRPLNVSRRRRPRRRGLGVAMLAGVVLLVAGSVLAQSTNKKDALAPPTPPAGNSSSSMIVSILIGIVMGGLVLGVAFIPSKRGHQD